MPTAIALFTRDLRVRDNPVLTGACQAGHVVPLFVLDPALLATAGANRICFLTDSLRDLDASLHERGGRLAVRRGAWADEVMRVATTVDATAIHVAHDVSTSATRRLESLRGAAARERVDVVLHASVTVVEPGAIRPSGSTGESKVFTPYYRRWLDTPKRVVLPAPDVVDVDPRAELRDAPLDALDETARRHCSPNLLAGGEREGLRRFKAWTAAHLHEYAERHDDLPGDATSRISAFLHFGCLSPNEVAMRLEDRPGGAPFVRQLCWRDFFHQVLAARPDAAHDDYRPRGDRWNDDAEADDAFAAWCAGRTGYPLVDAAMRQLADEGFMHNRARMVVASFLTKDLYQDWRRGAAHFMRMLVDADVANNQLNWQWTAGTGTDTNPTRIFNPVVQGQRFDPRGEYIRRYVPELADLDSTTVHWPSDDDRARCGYPPAIVDHREAIAEYRAALADARTRRG